MAVTCPGCNKKFALGDDAAGQRFRCDTCGAVFEVPPAIVRQAIPVAQPRHAAPGQPFSWPSLIAALVLGTVCSSCVWGWIGAISKPATPEPQFVSGAAYNANQVYQDWRADPKEAAATYRDKRFTIFGTVKARENGGRVLVLADFSRAAYSARCLMRLDDPERLRSVEFHSLVEIRGTCSGPLSKKDQEIVFNDCELITVQAGEHPFLNPDD